MSQSSVILPGSPLTGSSMVADINLSFASVISKFSGAAAPTLGPGSSSALAAGQDWLNTTTSVFALNIYDGAQFLPWMNVDTVNHLVSANFSTVNGGKVASTMFAALAVNFNSANTDTTIPIVLPAGVTNYLVKSVRLANASASISTATFGLFSASGGGGTAIMAAGQAITVTSAAANTNNNAQTATPATSNTQSYNFANLFFRVGTAQGSAATADVIIEIVPLY
jgi:hypothetical protein